MQIYQKRNTWYLIEEGKDVRLFSSKEEAEDFVVGKEAIKVSGAPTILAGARGYQSSLWFGASEESLDGSTEEKESSEEEASTDKQTFVFGSEGSGKKEV